MRRRDFLGGMAAAGTLSMTWGARGEPVPSTTGIEAAEPSPAWQTEKGGQHPPNILMFFPDQWRFDWMSTNRELPIRTPNLDRIALRGTRFTNVVVPSPLCAPARACISSGVEYAKCGTPSNYFNYPIGREGAHYYYPVRKTFYTALREKGYDVLCSGKMDLAKGCEWWGLDGMWRLPLLGFTRGINTACKGDDLNGYEMNDNKPADPYTAFMQKEGLLDIYLADLRKRFATEPVYAATFTTPVPETAYQDNWIGANGLKLIDSVPQGKPWFLQVCFGGPHTPLDITPRMEASVRGRKMPPSHEGMFSSSMDQKIRQNYTAMCENIDRLVGLYLEKLASRGELENTIVVFSSDHGEMLGDKGHIAKNLPYQASVSVPLTITGPGMQQGVTSDALVSTLDLTATYLDYGGAAGLPEMDSKTLRPLLEGKSSQHREVAFSALGAWRMAYDGRYKVIRGFDPSIVNPAEWTVGAKEVRNAPPLVFDLKEDPWEDRNLAENIPVPAQKLLERLS